MFIWDKVIDYCINQGPGFVFGGVMFFLYWRERADRREAWKKNNEYLGNATTLAIGINKALDANTFTIAANTKTLEGSKCKYFEKN